VNPERDGPTTILLVDDDAMARAWIRLMLAEGQFRIVGEAADASEALALAARRRPRILLVDYRLADGTGAELVSRLLQEGVAAAAVLIASRPEPGMNVLARQVGAQGTLLKSESAGELLSVLCRVRDGEPSFDPRHPSLGPGFTALTPRERQVLRLLADGSTNVEVAAELGIGAQTVKTLVARTFAKLGVRRRAEAAAKAQRMGLL